MGERLRSRSRWLLSAALIMMLALTACSEPAVSDDAGSKAQELESKLSDLSIDLPEGAAALLGEDGAHLCAAADSEDHLALVAFTPNGFALRKLGVDKKDVEFAGAVIDVYCPENRETFDDYVSGLAVEGS